MSQKYLDSIEQEAPPPSSPLSAFLWWGLAALGSAALIGILSVTSAHDSNGSPLMGFFIALCVFVAGAAMLFAQSRFLFWRSAANVKEWHSLAPASHRKGEGGDPRRIRADIAILTGVFLLALIPRFVLSHQSYSVEELWTLRLMDGNLLTPLRTLQEGNNHPLYALLASVCVEVRRLLLGTMLTQGIPPEWVVRLPAVLFGSLAVPVLFLACKDVMGRTVAFVAVMLLALSPAAIDISSMARGYSLVIFFVVLQAWCLSRAIARSEAGAWVGWVLSSVGGVFTHPSYFVIIIAHLLFISLRAFLFAVWQRNGLRGLALFEQGILMTVAWLALTAICYVQNSETVGTILRPAYSAHPLFSATRYLPHLVQYWSGMPRGSLLNACYILSGVLLLLGIWYLVRRSSIAALYLPVMLLSTLTLYSFWTPVGFNMHWFQVALPAFITLLSAGLCEVADFIVGSESKRETTRDALLAVATAGFFLLTLPGLSEIFTHPRQELTRTAERLREEKKKEKTVVAVGKVREDWALFGIPSLLPGTQAELKEMLSSKRELVVVDTSVPTTPGESSSPLVTFLRRNSNKTSTVYPGRFSAWPSPRFDGSGDIRLYRLISNSQNVRNED